MASSPTSCVPSPASVPTTGRPSRRWWSSRSTTQRSLADPAMRPSMRPSTLRPAPLAPPCPLTLRFQGEDATTLTGRVTALVRAFLQELQDQRKAEGPARAGPAQGGASRRDVHTVQFEVGHEVLLDTENTPLPVLCSPCAGWAPSVSSRARRPARNASTYQQCGAPSTSSTSSACAPISTVPPASASAATRMWDHCRQFLARRRPRAPGAGAAQVQDALRQALHDCVLDRLGRGGRHMGTA